MEYYYLAYAQRGHTHVDNEWQSCSYSFLTFQLYMQFAGLQSYIESWQRTHMDFLTMLMRITSFAGIVKQIPSHTLNKSKHLSNE